VLGALVEALALRFVHVLGDIAVASGKLQVALLFVGATGGAVLLDELFENGSVGTP
jgi:hypothetical protein